MFKKLCAVFLAGMFVLGLSSQALAGRVVVEGVMDTTLNADPVFTNSDSLATGGYENIAFFVEYDESETDGGLSVAITCQLSYDDSTYMEASFYDYSGAATLQTSETLSVDGNYYFWLNKDLVAPYTRIIATATGSDADDTADVVVTFMGRE